MTKRPVVVVQPPDSRGLRRVDIGGEAAGGAWSPRGLRRILSRAGFPEDMDIEDRAAIRWREGDSSVWPDRKGRRYGTVAFMTAGLLGCAALLAVVGMPDAFGALTFAGRVSGFLFILAGVVEVAAAAAAIDFWGKRHVKYSGSLVVLGALVALATNSLFLLVWFQEQESTHYLQAFVPLWCWSMAALWLLYRHHAWEKIPHPKGFAVGVTVSALLAASNLAYSAVYQPYAKQPLLIVKATFGKPRSDPKRPVVYLPLTIHVENTGTVPVYILASAHSTYGRTATFTAGDTQLKDWKEDLEWDEDTELHVGSTGFTVLHTGSIVAPGSWLDQGDVITEERIVELPKNAPYDVIQATAELQIMRKDRGKIDEAAFSSPHYSWSKEERKYFGCTAEICDDHIFYRARLRHNNNLINVTRKPRYVTSYRAVNAEGSYFGAHIGPLNSKGELSGDEEPSERYGVMNYPSGTVTVPFATLLNPQDRPASGD
ncbi:hypothetical protein ACFWBF_14700 [Streptomyces sp. NPDC060028]|uniref:hypothetical protein n=1 Tax=Streptomyces sp. NPDC060028 TaxID=3347041 RepID=UPI0036C6B249